MTRWYIGEPPTIIMVWAASQPVVAGISNSVFLFSLAFVLLFRDKIVQVLRIGALALAFVVAKKVKKTTPRPAPSFSTPMP